jgi:hypothetical protein
VVDATHDKQVSVAIDEISTTDTVPCAVKSIKPVGKNQTGQKEEFPFVFSNLPPIILFLLLKP